MVLGQFFKDRDQIGFKMLVQRLVDFMTGLFSFIRGLAFSLNGKEPNHWAIGSNPPAFQISGLA